MNNFYALILAGGSGTRLWPLSQPKHPKALLTLLGKRTMFQMTVDRLQGLIPAEYIFVVARAELCSKLHDGSPEIPASNFIIEPCERNSGPALALGLLAIAKHDPNAVVAVLSVDHAIQDVRQLQQALRSAYRAAQSGAIVTLGIPATRPETRFGYIQRGAKLDRIGGFPVYRSQCFIEKPDPITANSLVQSGDYCWDSGMIVLSAAAGFAEFERQHPYLLQNVKRNRWANLPSISLDDAIMENAGNVLMLEMNLTWTDVGNWDAVFEILSKDVQGNVTAPTQIVRDTHNTMVYSNRLVVTIGVDDLIVIDTNEGLLICHRNCSEAVRIVTQQQQQGLPTL